MTRQATLGLILSAGLCVATPVFAQEKPVEPPQAIDASRLPIDLHRIERALRKSSEREERDGLNLRYFVEVYGRAPRIELFSRQDNLQFGPVPDSAPTHRDMLDVMTPREFRAPTADFAGFMKWLSEKLNK